MYINLDTIKKHLNIDTFFTDDDEYLMLLEDVAVNAVQKHIDCNLSELQDSDGVLPAPLLHAILLEIGNLYMQRESITYSNISEVPLSYTYLLDLYKDYSKKSEMGGIF